MATQTVTLSQIAKKAGFSRSTVGHVLNGRAVELRISQEACEHIQQVARQHNYVANPLARGLRGGQTGAIGILWSLSGPHAVDAIIRPLCSLLGQRQYISYILDHDSNPQNLIANLKNLLSRGADGIVLEMKDQAYLDHAQVAEMIRAFRLRILVTQEPVSFNADIVVHDRLTPIREMVTHLLTSGRRRFVYAPMNLAVNQFKADAILETVAAFGCGATATVVDLEKISSVKSFAAFNRHRAMQRADALLMSTDECATACLRWLEKTGRRCPEDVAVVGFNNSEFAQFLNPALATVDRSYSLLTEQIEQLIDHRLGHPDADYQTRYAPMKFICRASAQSSNELACYTKHVKTRASLPSRK